MPTLDKVRAHHELRRKGISLLASENRVSKAVREALGSDLAGRYGEDFYGGSRIAQEIKADCEDLARRLYRCKHALVTSTAGNICDLAAIFAYTREGDKVAMVHRDHGGYPFGWKKFHREHVRIPYDEGTASVRVDDAKALLDRERPKLTILGSSLILFPYPIRELSFAGKMGGYGFDGSHVLGLIQGGEFQDPLAEGAQFLIGSTHKSLPGPQGGLVLTNDAAVHEKFKAFAEFEDVPGIGLIDNWHPNRVAGLAVALEELQKRGREYARQVVKNSQALARALVDEGIGVKYAARGYSKSHQVLLDLAPEKAEGFSRKLEAVNLFADRMCRLGTQELAWSGMKEAEMQRIASWMRQVWDGETQGVAVRVEALAKEFLEPPF